jgi:hypothetical protein
MEKLLRNVRWSPIELVYTYHDLEATLLHNVASLGVYWSTFSR